jgi:hypothetical protein
MKANDPAKSVGTYPYGINAGGTSTGSWMELVNNNILWHGFVRTH